MVQAGGPYLVFGAGTDTIRGPRLYGRYAAFVTGSLRMRKMHEIPRSQSLVGGHALLPDHFMSREFLQR